MSALGANCHADCRRSLVTGPEPALCSGLGCHHSPTAEKDPRPLLTITMPDVCAMLNDPACDEKHAARWFIPSTLLSRIFEEQRQNGTFYCLWAETDEPSGTLRDMAARVADVVGVELWVYTTRSATPDRQKTRFLLPLAESVPGQVFVLMQEVFNDHLQACGIPPDRANERAGQLCYLPNRGAFYDSVHLGRERLLHYDDWREPVAAIQKRKQDEEEEAQRQREISRLKARERVSRGQASPIDAMNAEYRLPDVLLQYGYSRRGNRWLSPLSESGRAGVMITKDGRKWISVHASDVAAGLGIECANGCMGDVFDLFCHFEHGGDRKAAMKAAATLLDLGGVDHRDPHRRTKPVAVAKPPRSEDSAREQAGEEPLPEPVDLWADPPAPECNLAFLPDILREYAEAWAEANGSDPAGIATCLLAAMAPAMHRAGKVSPYQDGRFHQPPVLFSLVLAPSGRGKGEAGTNGTTPLATLNRFLRQQAKWDRDKYGRLDPEEKRREEPPRNFSGLLPSDITPEGLATLLAEGTQFPLYYLPEASRLIAGMGRYATSGGDVSERAFWNAMYDGGDYSVSRARGTIDIENAGCNILGLTTMNQIRAQADNAEIDGFFPRFLIVYLNPELRPAHSAPDLPKLRMRALALPFWMFMDGPIHLTFDHEAEEAFRTRWFDYLNPYADSLEDTQPGYAAAIRRVSGRLIRYMLIDAAIRRAESRMPGGVNAGRRPAGIRYDKRPQEAITVQATLADFERAWQFAQWNMRQADLFYSSILPSSALVLAQAVAPLLLTGQDSIRRNDIARARVREWERSDEVSRKAAVRLLIDRGWLLDAVRTKKRMTYRMEDAEAWTINPLLKTRFQDRMRLMIEQSEKQKRLRDMLGIGRRIPK